MKIKLIIGFLLLGLNVHAQQLSLDAYRKRVYDYSQEIRKSELNIQGAKRALRSVRTGFFPKIDVTGSYSYQLEAIELMPGTTLAHDNYGIEANLAQNVYAGGAVQTQAKQAKAQQSIAELANTYTTENVLYAADINYWTAVANYDLYRVSIGYVEIISQLYRLIENRFNEGGLSKTDLYMVKNRLQEAELQSNTAYQNFKQSVYALNMLMGEDKNSHVVFIDSLYNQEKISIENEENLLDQRTDYLLAQKEQQLTTFQTKLIKSQFRPQLAIGIKEKYGTGLINLDGATYNTTIAYAQLNIPVFHWGDRHQKVKMSKIQEETKQLDVSKLADQIRLEVANAEINLIESEKRVDIVNSSLEIAKKSLELNTYSYNEGRLPIIDVLSAQVAWLQSYNSVISVNYKYKLAVAEYLKAKGQYRFYNE